MPYFRYQGVNLSGRIRTGKLFAADMCDLDTILLKRDIAFISATEASTRFLPRITKETVMRFFERLSMLLRAGILLPDALIILRDSFSHVRMQLVIADLYTKIEQGIPLHKALERHKDVFDERMVHMVYIGQETGSLAITVHALAEYIQTVMAFRAKIKSAVMGPIISFTFFIGIVLILIVGIIPTLAAVFESAHQQLPAITQALLAISGWLRSWYGMSMILFVIFAVSVVLKTIKNSATIKRMHDSIVLRIPYVRRFVYDTQRVWFLDSLVLLVKGKMPLNVALSVAQHSCTNDIIYTYVATLEQAVSQGKPLTSAFQQCPGEFFSQEDNAIIAVGESACQLSLSLAQIADNSRNHVARSVHYMTTVIQPLLFIILGLMITLLIVAMYAPMFTLSWVIT